MMVVRYRKGCASGRSTAGDRSRMGVSRYFPGNPAEKRFAWLGQSCGNDPIMAQECLNGQGGPAPETARIDGQPAPAADAAAGTEVALSA
jgi:hypothetical protein